MKELGTSTPIEKSGYLLPWDKDNDSPCMIMIEDVRFIPVFSDEEKLNAHLEFTKYKCTVSTKMITDVDDFLESVQPYRIALNPRATERNTTRFTEIKKL